VDPSLRRHSQDFGKSLVIVDEAHFVFPEPKKPSLRNVTKYLLRAEEVVGISATLGEIAGLKGAERSLMKKYGDRVLTDNIYVPSQANINDGKFSNLKVSNI
jgi:replicative superfamily II helicase